MKVGKKERSQDLIEKLKTEIIALNTRTDGGQIITRADKITVHKLPSVYPDLQALTHWAIFQYRSNLALELGTIAANDNT